MSRYVTLAAVGCGLLWLTALGERSALPADPNPSTPIVKTDLPHVPPKSPAESLASMRVQDGCRVELVAAEPMVASPVAMAFDENWRMFVVEMRGYPLGREDRASRVRLLTDADGDGRFDRGTIYADGLLWPTAVACWDGGVFVADAPDILYFKDTDGDGRADVRRRVFTGFGMNNADTLLNSFIWTLDNRIEMNTSSSGGAVARVDEQGKISQSGRTVSVRGRNFEFDPRSLEFAATSGALQYGMSMDDWGRKFVCGNSRPIQQVMYEDRYLVRAPYVIGPPSRIEISADAGKGEIYRLSEVEAWRAIRTQRRVAGTFAGPVEGGGRPGGYFTAATGVTIYRGTALPKSAYGMAIVGEVASNLVHRERFTSNGLLLAGHRIDDHCEFIASTDNWFRPVQFAQGPDGALYMADMYRELIEAPSAIPPDVLSNFDTAADRDRGRIYRIVGSEFKQPSLPRLGKASTIELVMQLEHPNAWHRETASRLLYERQDRSAVAPLMKLAAESSRPLARLHALYALAGLDALDEKIVVRALNDEHSQLRQHAVRLSERLGEWPAAVRTRLISMANDDLPVRYQLAFTLGLVPPDAARNAALIHLAQRDGESEWMRLALLVSMSADGADPLFDELVRDPSFRRGKAGKEILEGLATAVGARGAALAPAVDEALGRDSTLTSVIVRGYTKGLLQSGRSLKQMIGAGEDRNLLRALRKQVVAARATAVDEMKSPSSRVQSIKMLVIDDFAPSRDLLAQLLDQRQPQEVQQAVLTALEAFNDPGVATLLLSAWPTLGPRARGAAAEALLARPDRITALLDAVERGSFQAGELEAPRIQLLLSYGNVAIRQRAARLLGSLRLGRRQDVVDSYRGALQLAGNAARGKELFQKTCAACHRADQVGHDVGPNLSTAKNRGAEFILFNVLDPSREVNPQYVNYMLVTDDGRTMTGMIAEETASAITLRRAEGVTDIVLRANIEQIQSTNLSLMPEGLEKQLDPQAMADLIAYILSLV